MGKGEIPGFSHTSTNTTSFPKPPNTFFTCFSRGKRRNHNGNKVCLRVSNSKPPDHESDTFTTVPPGRDCSVKDKIILRLSLK